MPDKPDLELNAEFTRRDFVRVAGTGLLVAGASAAVSKTAFAQTKASGQPLPKLEQPLPNPPDQRVGYAVVGLGKFALNQILPNFEAGQKQDYSLDLPSGQFLILCDSRAIGDTRRLAASLSLLTPDGAPLPNTPSPLTAWNREERLWRDGKSFSLDQPQSIMLRLKNTDSEVAAKFWLTVIPDQPKFVRFGFGNEVIEAQIGQGKGVGASIQYDVLNFQRVTLPAGKWSIGLHVESKESTAYASLLALDERGFYNEADPLAFHMVAAAPEYGGQKTTEKIVTLTGPKTFIFRIWNEGSGDQHIFDYNLTIQKVDG